MINITIKTKGHTRLSYNKQQKRYDYKVTITTSQIIARIYKKKMGWGEVGWGGGYAKTHCPMED